MRIKTTWHWRAIFAMVLFSAFALSSANAARAQDPTSETNIEVRLEVYRAADLVGTPIDFGTILINGDMGSVTMDAAGALSLRGGILETYDGPYGAARAGTLTMDANAGATANITLDAAVNLGGGVTFTPAVNSTAVTMIGGPVTVSVYGTLDFPANTATGNYDGLLSVNVSYN